MCGKNPDILQLSGPDSNLDTQIQQFSVILLIIKKNNLQVSSSPSFLDIEVLSLASYNDIHTSFDPGLTTVFSPSSYNDILKFSVHIITMMFKSLLSCFLPSLLPVTSTASYLNIQDFCPSLNSFLFRI